MIRYTTAALFVLALSQASSSLGASDSHLRIHVYNQAGLSDKLVSFSEQETSRLLTAALPVEWLNCEPSPHVQCDQYLWSGDMSVSIVPSGRPGMTRDALGLAHLADRGRYAVIAFDRAVALQDRDVPLYSVLGKVMAHEIAHLLDVSHTSTGVMRPLWSKDELRVGRNATWFYTTQQLAAMRESVKERLSNCCEYLAELM